VCVLLAAVAAAALVSKYVTHNWEASFHSHCCRSLLIEHCSSKDCGFGQTWLAQLMS
jgi:hypothetical protein